VNNNEGELVVNKNRHISKRQQIFYTVMLLVGLGLFVSCSDAGDLPLSQNLKKLLSQSSGGSSNQELPPETRPLTVQEINDNILELNERIVKLIGFNKEMVGQLTTLRKKGCFLRKPLKKMEIILGVEDAPHPNGSVFKSEKAEGMELQVDMGSLIVGSVNVKDAVEGEVSIVKEFAEDENFTLNDIQRLVIEKTVKGGYHREVLTSEQVCTDNFDIFLVSPGWLSDAWKKVKRTVEQIWDDGCYETQTVESFAMREKDMVQLNRLKIKVIPRSQENQLWPDRVVFDEILTAPKKLNNLQSMYSFSSFVGNPYFYSVSEDADCENVHDTVIENEKAVRDWLQENTENTEDATDTTDTTDTVDIVDSEGSEETGISEVTREPLVIGCQIVGNPVTGEVSCNNSLEEDSNNDLLPFEAERGIIAHEQNKVYETSETDSSLSSNLSQEDSNTTADLNNTLALVQSNTNQNRGILFPDDSNVTQRMQITPYDQKRVEWEMLKGVFDEVQGQYYSLWQEKNVLTDEGCFYQQPISRLSIRIVAKVYHNLGGEFKEAGQSALDISPTRPGSLADVKPQGWPRGIRVNLGFRSSIPLFEDIKASESDEYILPPGYFRNKLVKNIRFIRLTKRGVGRKYQGALSTFKQEFETLFSSHDQIRGDNWVAIEEDIIRIDSIELKINNEVAYGAYNLKWVLSESDRQFADFAIKKNPEWRRQSGKIDCDSLEIVGMSR